MLLLCCLSSNSHLHWPETPNNAPQRSATSPVDSNNDALSVSVRSTPDAFFATLHAASGHAQQPVTVFKHTHTHTRLLTYLPIHQSLFFSSTQHTPTHSRTPTTNTNSSTDAQLFHRSIARSLDRSIGRSVDRVLPGVVVVVSGVVVVVVVSGCVVVVVVGDGVVVVVVSVEQQTHTHTHTSHSFVALASMSCVV